MMDDEQQEIIDRVTAFFRNWEQYEASDRNPFYRSEAEQALKIAAQLAQVEQAKQLKRQADAMEKIAITLSSIYESPMFG
jgi:hypothetical protein